MLILWKSYKTLAASNPLFNPHNCPFDSLCEILSIRLWYSDTPHLPKFRRKRKIRLFIKDCNFVMPPKEGWKAGQAAKSNVFEAWSGVNVTIYHFHFTIIKNRKPLYLSLNIVSGDKTSLKSYLIGNMTLLSKSEYFFFFN